MTLDDGCVGPLVGLDPPAPLLVPGFDPELAPVTGPVPVPEPVPAPRPESEPLLPLLEDLCGEPVGVSRWSRFRFVDASIIEA